MTVDPNQTVVSLVCPVSSRLLTVHMKIQSIADRIPCALNLDSKLLPFDKVSTFETFNLNFNKNQFSLQSA